MGSGFRRSKGAELLSYRLFLGRRARGVYLSLLLGVAALSHRVCASRSYLAARKIEAVLSGHEASACGHHNRGGGS